MADDAAAVGRYSTGVKKEQPVGPRFGFSDGIVLAPGLLVVGWLSGLEFSFNTPLNGAVSAFGCLVVLFIMAYLYYPRFQMYWIPGPTPKLLVGNVTPDISEKLHLFQQEIAKEYGPVVRYFGGRIPFVMISDCDLIKDVMVSQFRDSFHAMPLPWFDVRKTIDHLVAQRGEKWRSSRRALQPSFNTWNLQRFADDVNQSGRDFIARLDGMENGATINVFREFGKMVVQAISSTSFGQTISQTDNSATIIMDAIVGITDNAGSKKNKNILWAQWFPELMKLFKKLPSKKIDEIRNSYNKIGTLMVEMANDHRTRSAEDKEKNPCFMSLLVDAKDDEGQPLGDKELVDQARLFIIAGFETTSVALALTAYEIARRPDVQKSLYEEIDRLCPDDDVHVTYQDLKKFEYLHWAVYESLRMYPPSASRRESMSDCSVGGYFIPEGTRIVIPAYTIQRDEKYFPDPDTFRPERWDPNCEESKSRHPYAFLAFGAGPRKCIGYQFALEEMKLLMIHIYKNYTFDPSPKNPDPLDLWLSTQVLSPTDAIWLKMKPRK